MTEVKAVTANRTEIFFMISFPRFVLLLKPWIPKGSYPDRADGTLFNVRKQHAPPKFFPNCGVWKFSDKKGLGLATIWRNRARFRRNLNNFVLASSKILIICPNITWQYK
jgi:hypothetical protein